MADIVFGILIKGKDLAGQAFGSAAKGAKGLASSVKSTAATIASTAKGIVGNLANIDAGFRIAGKGARLLTQGITSLVHAALESRAANDQQRKDWEAYSKLLKEIAALAGGPLLTAFLAVADAFAPLLKTAKEWLKVNQDTMATGFAEWIATTGQLLVSALASGVIAATRAYNGLALAMTTVKSAGAEAASGLELGLSKFLKFGARFERMFGDKQGLAAIFEDLSKGTERFSRELDDSGDKFLAEAARQAQAMEEQEATIRQVEEAIRKAFGEVGVAAIRRSKDEVIALNQATSDLVFDLSEDMARAAALRESYFARGAEAEKQATDQRIAELDRWFVDYKDTKTAEDAISTAVYEKQKKQGELLGEILGDGFMTAYGVAKEAFAGIGETIDGKTKTWEMAFGQFAERTAAIILEKLLISGVLKVLSLIGGALIGGGAGLFATAGADALAGPFNKGGIVGHNRGGIAGYAGGGVVAGAIGANRDTEIIAATTGEGILTRRTTEMVARDLGGGAGGGHRSTPPPIAHAAPSSGIVVAPMFGSPNRTDLDRVSSNVLRPSQARLERRRAWNQNLLPMGR